MERVKKREKSVLLADFNYELEQLIFICILTTIHEICKQVDSSVHMIENNERALSRIFLQKVKKNDAKMIKLNKLNFYGDVILCF